MDPLDELSDSGGDETIAAADVSTSDVTMDGSAIWPAKDANAFFPQVDGYEIVGRLGEGGMGVVWRAVQKSTHRAVALKLMSTASFGSDRARLRFQREVDLTARLEHPHIARVYDGGECRGICYYAMELIDAVPLDLHVRNLKLTRRQILELMNTICQAVQYAHQKGVIHRDLKPANILVDKEGQPRVLDFGLAKALSDDDGQMLSIDAGAMGTPAFMSPEQAAGHLDRVDTRSDVYTLGVILFYLLCGKFPHEIRGSAIEIMKRISETQPTRLRQIEPRVDGDLEALLSKALDREPERRYASAGGMAADLGRYLNGEPLEAQPPTLGYLLAKRVRKNRAGLSIAAAVVSVLLGTAAWAYVRITREKNAAIAATYEKERQRQEAQAQKNDADRQRNIAVEQRERAELRTAESLLAQGNAFGWANRWSEARTLYDEARESFLKLNVPQFAADVALAKSYARSPACLLTLTGHESRVDAVVVCPDGFSAVTGSEDGTIRIWDLKMGRLLRTLRGHTNQVRALDLSSDGQFILSGSLDKTLKVWNLQSGKSLKTLVGHTDGIRTVAISPDGKTAISGGFDQVLRLWDLDSGNQIWASPDQTRPINSVCFMPDGRTALSAADSDVTLWDLAGRKSLKILHRKNRPIFALRVCGNGQQALLAGDGEILLVDLHGNVLQRLTCPTGPIATVNSQPGENNPISGSQDGSVRAWDWETGRERRAFSGHTAAVLATGIASAGRIVLSASSDKTLKLWDLKDEQDAHCFKRKVRGLAVSPDGHFGLSGNLDGSITLFDLATSREIRSFHGSVHSVRDVVFVPGGKYALASNAELTTLTLWDLASGTEVHVLRGHEAEVIHVAVSPDGLTALSCSKDMTVKWWDLGTGKLMRTLSGHKGEVTGVAYCVDRRNAVSVGAGEIKVWNLETGTERTMRLQDHTEGVAVCPDGVHVVWALGNKLGLLNLQTGLLVRTFVGHVNRISRNAIAVTPDGRFIVSCSLDKTMKIWELQSGKELQSYEHSGSVECVALSPDGRTLLCGTAGIESVQVWDWNRPAIYREMDFPLRQAQAALQFNSNNPDALALLGRWWAFRGINDWGAELLEKARSGGAVVPSITLGRCYWQMDRIKEARLEFQQAMQKATDEHDRHYLQSCMEAMDRELANGPPPHVN